MTPSDAAQWHNQFTDGFVDNRLAEIRRIRDLERITQASRALHAHPPPPAKFRRFLRQQPSEYAGGVSYPGGF